MILLKVFTLILFFTSTLFAEHYIGFGKKQTLTKLSTLGPLSQKSRSIISKSPISYYKDTKGKRLGIDNTLIVSFLDLSIQLYVEKEFSLTLVKTLNPTMFVYQVADKDITLKTCNSLADLQGVKFAHPDFIIPKKSKTNDPRFNVSWHLHDTGRHLDDGSFYSGINVEEAWNVTKGEDIIVGLYDEGIDIEHQDLRDNILGYGNFDNASGGIDIVDGSHVRLDNSAFNAPKRAPKPGINGSGEEVFNYPWHGTSCAGLIVASENDKGSVGVAPKSKLLALRYASSNISRDIEAFNAMANHGAAIITNSWGTYHNVHEAFNETLKDLSENGRNNKGILIFFAAGNDGCNMDEYYESPEDNNQLSYIECRSSSDFKPINDESESPYVISIAATVKSGSTIAPFSNYGSSIDFAAPGSDIYTTDAMGSKGTTSSNYTDSFSGTSAAAPIVAGVTALVLSANPLLSKEEVVDILKYTAHRRNLNHFDGNGNLNIKYRNLVPSTFDESGRNDHWGYGRINAGKAVKLAQEYGKVDIENFAHKIYKDMH